MDFKSLELKVGMTKDEVNFRLNKKIFFMDVLYRGWDYKHNWKCLCGNKLYTNVASLHSRKSDKCIECIKYEREQRYKTEVEKTGEYEYIRSYRKGDTLPNGKVIKEPYIEIKHLYCGSIYCKKPNAFIRENQRCGQCCRTYENSFAHHIEKELRLKLEDVWDFDKNTLNPYHISKGSGKKVWIKCQEKDYHGSYEIKCDNYLKGYRCSYCSSKKIHPLDSFGYHNFDKVMSWHPDNNISPFKVSLYNNNKYKFICETCGYEWSAMIGAITNSHWCPMCKTSKGEKQILDWLRKKNIKYTYEQTFEGLRGLNKGKLSYDFYLPDYNLLIEYQGEQHEKYIPGFHTNNNEFKKQQEHDRRKREYAKDNDIELLEIWYYDFDNIEEILRKNI